ncbi:MAG: hydroxymethylbilane synthase [Chloroflexota bacterium]|nr:MAG: hydroxymethylbilane synthase [Chloroflexota bacterium]
MPEPSISRPSFCLGTRSSELALWQTHHVGSLLQEAWPGMELVVETISTRGDQILDTPLPLIGGKGLFTAELEAALRGRSIDAAVHSLKDLPTESPAELTLGAIPERVNPADALVCRSGLTLGTLPLRATVGTSSRRRAAQLLSARPDLTIIDIRGNVPTRIRKALDPDGPYDAVVLAYAGLQRLERLDVISQVLPMELMLPAPGQGALAVQCRDEAGSIDWLAPLDHAPTRVGTTAERAFLAGLGGGCAVPIAAYAQSEGEEIRLQGRVAALDGSRQIDVEGRAPALEAGELGSRLAGEALALGAARLLEETA